VQFPEVGLIAIRETIARESHIPTTGISFRAERMRTRTDKHSRAAFLHPLRAALTTIFPLLVVSY